jgi:DNA processing protein
MEGARTIDNQERAALLGLWAIPGVGPKSLERIARDAGPLGALLDVPCREWAGSLQLTVPVRERLGQLHTLRAVSARVQERVEKGRMRVAFPGDVDYPENLVGLADAPPLLFVLGERRPGPRRRLAMVGSRALETGFKDFATGFALKVARAGIGIVSGAAWGTDQACHDGALAIEQESWAFLGSALDELDASQAALAKRVLGHGGVFYSELPPGVRASRETFPRRNRLISGASDAVLVMRATKDSGSLHTALAAHGQGRPLLALPGDMNNSAAEGANALIRSGKARICLGIEDVLAAVGLDPGQVDVPPEPVVDEALSEPARVVLGALGRSPRAFEEVKGFCGLASGAVTSALCELELLGLVLQRPGKVYEKV